MSIAQKILQDASAAGNAAVDSDMPEELLKTTKLLWTYGDNTLRRYLIRLYIPLGILLVSAFFPTRPVLMLMAVLPVAGMVYALHKWPVGVLAAGTVDQKILEGALRKLVFTVAFYEMLATIALRGYAWKWLPLQNHPREILFWIIIVVLTMAIGHFAFSTSMVDMAKFALFVGLVVLSIVFFASGDNGTNGTATNNAAPEDTPREATDNGTTSYPEDRPSSVTESQRPTEAQASQPAVEAQPPLDPVNKDPFYSVRECSSEPYSFEPDGSDTLVLTAQPECWTAIINMPLGSCFTIEARGPVDKMDTTGQIVEPEGATGFIVCGEPTDSYHTFRLKARNQPEPVTITITQR